MMNLHSESINILEKARMKNKPRTLLLIFIVLTLAGLACNYPFFGSPTPIIFPTPDFTMTAIFNPTETALLETLPTETLTQLPPTPLLPTNTLVPTDTLVPTPTSTPLPPTPAPTNTNTPTQSFVGPGARPRYGLAAYYFSNPPEIDTNSNDWKVDPYPVEAVVFGKGDHKGVGDLSARVRLGWDEDYLYLYARVIDDVYAQNASGANLFKGDSLEILLDTNVSADYYLAALTLDDYQLGISPGSDEPGEDTEAYLWFPTSSEGSKDNVKIAAREREDGYVVEAAIPWSVFDVSPSNGRHFGFAISISDNDDQSQNLQQSMVSSSPIRVLADPTTWGDLVLIKD
jgi:hypothetical protein